MLKTTGLVGLLLLLLLLLCSSQGAAAPAAVGLVFRHDLLSSVTTAISARIEATVQATHPPPYQPNGQVTFSNFVFEVALQTFTFGPFSGWQYAAQFIQFNYHVQSGIFGESGTVWIFTTNENQKTLTMDAVLSFAQPTPSIQVLSSAYAVQQGDLFLVGHCSDTICLIPVSDIIDPIAKAYFPALQKAIQSAAQTEGTKALSRILDVFSVKLGTSGASLVFHEEGALTTDAQGSLVYSAAGATYVHTPSGQIIPPPVANTQPLPDAALWGEQSDVSLALGPYFFSCLLWGLSTSGELNVVATHAPASSPIQLTTNNAFFRAAMPGLVKFPGLNLTLALAPIAASWPGASINGTGVALGPMSWTMSFSIVNGSKPVVLNAMVLNVTLAINFKVVASAAPSNSIELSLTIQGHTSAVSLLQSSIGAPNLNAFNVIIKFALALLHIPPAHLAVSSDFKLSTVASDTSRGVFVLGLDGTAAVASPQRPPLQPRPSLLLSSSSSASTPTTATASNTDPTSFFAATQPCGDGRAACAANTTCCNAAGGGFSCCPLPHASCCAQLGYCCPEGQGCTSDNPPRCNPWG